MSSTTACKLCASPGDFGDTTPDDPWSGLCPACVTAGHPTRIGLEQAVVTVAAQQLAETERLNVATATPEELVYHVTGLAKSLRSVLQLVVAAPTPDQTDQTPRVTHICGHCRTSTDQPTAVRTVKPGTGPAWGIVACPSCAGFLRGDDHR